MKWLKGVATRPEKISPSVVTIGNFDGVHLGHQALIAETCRWAQKLTAQSVVMSFDPHPAVLLGAREGLQRLYNINDLGPQFKALGVDTVVVEPFNERLAQLSPEDFVKSYLVEGLRAQAVVVGHDFRFGRGRAGNFEVLTELGSSYGFSVQAVEAVHIGEQLVSSSEIRRHLANGEAAQAAALLGRDYEIFGQVVHGEKRGRELGFATANLKSSAKFSPATGVYAGQAWIDSQPYVCVSNLGHRPTFENEMGLMLETHILDQNMDLYGQRIKVSLAQRLRGERKFSGPEALKRQIEKDIEACRQWAENKGV